MGKKRGAKHNGKREPQQARRSREGLDTETCPASGRKVRFSSRKRALTRANTLRASKADVPPLRVYHCHHCGDWHFTSSIRPPA